ncbi:MAG: phosphotransferase [Ilumatobacteraceae bacterium]|nr:phosphotransferase [Ilumatobacteraceae bacterium]
MFAVAAAEDPGAGAGDDRPLPGGWQTTVHRAGDHVRRSPNEWSASVINLLHHLERSGFSASPQPIESGFDADGNELLTYIDGVSPQPSPWTEEAIVRIGELLAELHAALASYEPPADAVWKDWFGRRIGNAGCGFGHGDLGPWNIMAIDGMPSGFIDWDTAGPMDPIYELAQAAWLNVQLHDDDIAARVGLGDVGQRARRLRLMLDAYDLPLRQRVGFVDKMVEVAMLDAAGEAIAHNVAPDTLDGTAADGYPFVWGIAWRTRSAAWILRNRATLEAAIR